MCDSPDQSGVYGQCSFSVAAVYTGSRLQIHCMQLAGSVFKYTSSIYCRYTAYPTVYLQCTLHGTADTLHFGLGEYAQPTGQPV